MRSGVALPKVSQMPLNSGRAKTYRAREMSQQMQIDSIADRGRVRDGGLGKATVSAV